MSLAVALMLLVIPCACNSQQLTKLVCHKEYHGVYGQPSLLDCKLQSVGNDVTIMNLFWKKNEQEVLVFNGTTHNIPGFKFAMPGWNNKSLNVSLLVTNTKMEDEGEYECLVYTDSGDAEYKVSLHVTAMYTAPSMTSTVIPEHNIEKVFYCNSTDRTENGMIWWFDEDGKNLTDRAKYRTTKDNGRFSLFSELSVRTDVHRKYTCKVVSITGGLERITSYKGTYNPLLVDPTTGPGPQIGRHVSKWVAPVVVIGSLIIGLLVTLLIFRRRTQQYSGPHLEQVYSNTGERKVLYDEKSIQIER